MVSDADCLITSQGLLPSRMVESEGKKIEILFTPTPEYGATFIKAMCSVCGLCVPRLFNSHVLQDGKNGQSISGIERRDLPTMK
jgi:hypothetical protein